MRKFCRCRVNIDKCKSCINSRRMDLTGFFNRITLKLENVKLCAGSLGPTAPPRMRKCFSMNNNKDKKINDAIHLL